MSELPIYSYSISNFASKLLTGHNLYSSQTGLEVKKQKSIPKGDVIHLLQVETERHMFVKGFFRRVRQFFIVK